MSDPQRKKQKNGPSCDSNKQKGDDGMFGLKVGLLSMPTEVLLMIFEECGINDFFDVVSLSLTCKRARDIYNSDHRIGLRNWPNALELLELQRPGAFSPWIEQNLRRNHYRMREGQEAGDPAYKFLDSDTITDQSLSSLDSKVVNVSAARKVQARNHAYMKTLASNHALFESRITFDSEFRLDGQYSNKKDGMGYLNKVRVELTASERSRIIKTIYTAAVLELKQYAFIYERRSSYPYIDLMPILNLSLRETLELYVVLQVLFAEATPVDRRAGGCDYYGQHPPSNVQNKVREGLSFDISRDRLAFHDSQRQKRPLFYTEDLHSILFGVLMVRLKIICDRSYLNIPLFRTGCCLGKYLDCIDRANHPLRSIFWDENQHHLSGLFEDLDKKVAASQSPYARLYFAPPPPNSSYEDICSYLDVFNKVAASVSVTARGSLYELWMLAPVSVAAGKIRVDSLLRLDTLGADDHRWGIFEESEVTKMKMSL